MFLSCIVGWGGRCRVLDYRLCNMYHLEHVFAVKFILIDISSCPLPSYALLTYLSIFPPNARAFAWPNSGLNHYLGLSQTWDLSRLILSKTRLRPGLLGLTWLSTSLSTLQLTTEPRPSYLQLVLSTLFFYYDIFVLWLSGTYYFYVLMMKLLLYSIVHRL